MITIESSFVKSGLALRALIPYNVPMKRKRILSDYERRTDADGKDSYIYTGPMFTPNLSRAGLFRFRAAAWILPIVGFLLWLRMCLLDTEGMRQMYIALPCVSLFLPLCMLIGDAYKITVQRRPAQRAEYERGYAQMRRCSIAVASLSSAVVVAQAVFLLLTGAAPWGELAFLGIAAVIALLFSLFSMFQKKTRFITHR